jgi:hypothetical protein
MPLFYQVAAGNDDAQEADDSSGFSSVASIVQIKASSVESARINGGFRFDNIAVAKDATIQNAYLQLYAGQAAQDDLSCTVSAHDVDDADNFTDTADVTTRLDTKTTATVAVSALNLGTGWYVVAGLTAIIQEIVNRALWVSGQAIVILCEGSTASGEFRATSYDGTPSLAAKLTITVGAADPLDVAEAYRRGGVHARFAPML